MAWWEIRYFLRCPQSDYYLQYRLSADHARNITMSKRLVIRMAQQVFATIP
jgi:hypothetical protein